MDRHSKEQRSANMRAVKNKGSEIEEKLAKSLWSKGYRYRRNLKTIFGKPDIVFTKYKVAVFCDSEFWHGKDWETKKWKIKSNRNFWFPKIERNIERDKLVNQTLEQEGYIVLRFWGKDILKDTAACVDQIIHAVNKRKQI